MGVGDIVCEWIGKVEMYGSAWRWDDQGVFKKRSMRSTRDRLTSELGSSTKRRDTTDERAEQNEPMGDTVSPEVGLPDINIRRSRSSGKRSMCTPHVCNVLMEMPRLLGTSPADHGDCSRPPHVERMRAIASVIRLPPVRLLVGITPRPRERSQQKQGPWATQADRQRP